MAPLRHPIRAFLAGLGTFLSAFGAEEMRPGSLANQFTAEIQPLLKQFCLGCHSTEKQKGDLDLEQFTSFKEVLRHPKIWQGLVEQVVFNEMPPKEKPQPTPAERERLLEWANQALDQAAQAHAGDPGPVVLRRLNNAEYNFTVRDLTGVESLNPTKEFPVDSAAGEGFMNTGNSLVMSPSFIGKYLDAGKEIASHALLLPDGLRFSSKTTARDWSDELVTQIREFYREFSVSGEGDALKVQEIIVQINDGGRLPLEKYLAATLAQRTALLAGTKTPATVARDLGLNAKYLNQLWTTLNASNGSVVLDPLRAHWRIAQPKDAAALTTEIGTWQKALWKFNTIGHIGREGGPKSWQEPVIPLTARQEVRLQLSAASDQKELTLFLTTGDASDGNEHDFVVWENPRIVAPGRPDLALRDVRDFTREMSARRERLIATTRGALRAASELMETQPKIDLPALALKHEVDLDSLTTWLDYLGMGTNTGIRLDYLTNRLQKVSNLDFANGWGSLDTPYLVANSSATDARIPGRLKPHGVCVHPSEKLAVAVAWRSPVAGRVRVMPTVTRAHPECGNGITWALELRRGATRQQLASGIAAGNKPPIIAPIESLSVHPGDLVSLVIGPRDGNHSCDLTDIELVFQRTDGEVREWSLTQDIALDVLQSNPHPDRWGTPDIWHFYFETDQTKQTDTYLPGGSLLARWQNTLYPAEQFDLATALQELLVNGPSMDAGEKTPDVKLYRQLSSLGGPLFLRAWTKAHSTMLTETTSTLGVEMRIGLDPTLFGHHPAGTPLAPESLGVQAPSIIKIRLPADLANGAELVTTAVLHSETGADGSAQIQVLTQRPTTTSLVPDARVLVTPGRAADLRFSTAFDEFRQIFPPALCYTKIVPVDEAVTLTLLYREDEALSRLMLDDAQRARLDRLWADLHWVSQDAVALVAAFEQISEFATQDRPDMVVALKPMRQPILDRAAAYQRALVEAEPRQIESVLEFADRAYRRALTVEEKSDLKSLYQKLRDQAIPHDEAIRLTLARILVAPAFLYRLEKAADGLDSAPVSDVELANRLSYFLWSSQPDTELRAVAAAGKLSDPNELVAQAKRLLRDPRTRRLATEFACAWLHIHDFESLDEKSERHFPTFAGLRGAMYEESIRFFTDAFQQDTSVLSWLDADHTFLNEALAKHYSIPNIHGEEWRRVSDVKKYGRGGVLGLSAILAKQSGASRTSPILRGNWVAEVLLGDKLPRPPKDIPRLPEDEATETLTVRQLTEKHSSDPRCFGCHRRMDGFGFALEGFDAIGRQRTLDFGDRPIDTQATLFDHTRVNGAAGLREYLVTQKRDVVIRQFCRKLLGYALGRGVILSDNPLISEMKHQLETHEYHFSAAVETVLHSRQFREIRGRDSVAED